MNVIGALRRVALPLHGKLPGIAVAALLGLAAQSIAGGLGEPLARNPVLVAMLFGLLIGNTLQCPEALRPGLDFPNAICCAWSWCSSAFASPSLC